MHLKIIALDLDGTLAKEGVVEEKTWDALRAIKEAGYVLILVTGRRLSVIPTLGPFDELCEAIVAENGATLHYPQTDRVDTPFGKLADEVVLKLKKLDIGVEFGEAIAATWVPHDRAVLDVIAQTGYAATVEYNKGAVMILPPGATKGSGLKLALEELGYSTRNVLACGDAENDRSMFEQADLSVAVSNAIPVIRDLADTVLDQANGAGCRNMLAGLLKNKIPSYRCRTNRRIQLGRDEQNAPICLSSFNFLDSNWCIAGSSGTGKTWVAGLILEQLISMGYQSCIIDPEGDYNTIKALPRTIVFGDESEPPPSVSDVVTLLEYARISIVLDLCQYSLEEKRAYVQRFLQALGGLRARRGLPHWFLIDEAHYFCQNEGNTLSDLIVENSRVGGFAFVTYQVSSLPDRLSGSIDHWIITELREEQERQHIQNILSEHGNPISPSVQLDTIPNKKFYLNIGKTTQLNPPSTGVVSLAAMKRTIPHVRHLHKYLIAPLSPSKQFYFRTWNKEKPARPAASLWEFSQALPRLSPRTIRYHLERKDFERWLKDVIRDEELVRQLRKLDNWLLSDEALKETLCKTVSHRFKELERLF